MSPAPDATARFRRDLEAITGRAPDEAHRLGLAVSGGPDSLALLLLAHAAYPGAIAAATVDHGLRPEAAEEAAFVHRLCAQLAIPHAVLTRPEGFEVTGNLQDRARALRYWALHFWAGSGTLANAPPWRVEWVASAHQRDDVAETFLMRARRGAGVGGLAAMRASRPLAAIPGPPLVRPLLGWSRAELAGIVAAAGVTPIDDPSNRHPRFDRSRIRALIEATEELPPARLALAAANLRHAEDALDWIATREWAARSEIDAQDMVLIDCAELPYELRRRLARRAIDHVRFEFDLPGDWSGTGLDRLVAGLDAGETGTIAGVKAEPIHGRWRFTPAPARRSH